MRKLTLATARITAQPKYWLLEFMTSGSFLIGERIYSTLEEAQQFCSERRLRVIEVVR